MRRSRSRAFAELAIDSTKSSLGLRLEPNDPRPLYVQLADQLVEAIENEHVKPGDRLPAMRDLARELDCALVTVSQAYELLAARGRAMSRVGKGTFVAQRPDANPRSRGDGNPTSAASRARSASKA